MKYQVSFRTKTWYLHMWKWNFSSRVEKYWTCLLCSLMKYFSTLKEKLSPRGHVHVISFIHARVQPQSFHLNGNTIGFHPQIQKLKWEFTLLQVRWVSLHVGVSVITHSFTVKIDLNYQGTCKWLFIWLWLGAWYLSTAKCFKHKKYLYKKRALRTAV